MNEFELFALIPTQPIPFPTDTVRGDIASYDPDLIDLLSKLLEKDPTRRISLFDAKRHPWVLSAVPGRTKEEKEKWLRETDPGCVLRTKRRQD